MLNSIVTIVCITLIAFILFWFFKKPEKSGQKAQQKNGYQEIRVEVMGGYTPELIILKKSVPARIVFDRKDPSPCLDQIVFQMIKILFFKEKINLIVDKCRF